ncbi:MAG: lysoplasmalogenase [Anaerolineales bacterium]
MTILLIAALVFGVLNLLAVAKNWLRLESITKPAVMLALFFWLWMSTGLNGPLFWFGLGILFSLLGDVLLMISLDRLFLAGLVAFLLAHVAYVIGFNIPVPGMSAWGIALAVIIGVGGARVIRRIMDPLAAKGQGHMRMPILVYSIMISLLVLSAMLKLTDADWKAGAALLVSVGAFLFYISDIILAWNKFVALVPHGRIYNIAAYHLGQIALIAGVVMQYS